MRSKKTKIEYARKFFDEINSKINPDNVKYEGVNSFGKLMDIVWSKNILVIPITFFTGQRTQLRGHFFGDYEWINRL